MKTPFNLIGQEFAYLTVLADAGSNERGSKLWEVKCICGTIVYKTSTELRRKYARSCGCMNGRRASKRGTQSISIWNETIVRRICELAKQADISPSVWATEALGDWILAKRSGKYEGDPDRHTERNEEDETYALGTI